MADEKEHQQVMAEEIQKLDKALDQKNEEANRLRKERDWVIRDFAKSLQFHSEVKTTLAFHDEIIRQQMRKALGG